MKCPKCKYSFKRHEPKGLEWMRRNRNLWQPLKHMETGNSNHKRIALMLKGAGIYSLNTFWWDIPVPGMVGKLYHAATTRRGLAAYYTIKVDPFMRKGIEPDLKLSLTTGDPPLECFDVF